MIDLLIHTDRRYAGFLERARRHRSRRLRCLFGRLVRAAAGTLRRLVAWQRRHRLIAELRALDELVLADIGLCRGDILPTVDELMRRHRLAAEEATARRGALVPVPRFEAATRPVLVMPVVEPAHNDNAVAPSSPARRNIRR